MVQILSNNAQSSPRQNLSPESFTVLYPTSSISNAMCSLSKKSLTMTGLQLEKAKKRSVPKKRVTGLYPVVQDTLQANRENYWLSTERRELAEFTDSDSISVVFDLSTRSRNFCYVGVYFAALSRPLSTTFIKVKVVGVDLCKMLICLV